MSDTRNECRIVNELSETIEAELSEAVEELEAEIVEKATIDDTSASTTTTYSSEKIEDLIDNIPTGTEIDDSTETSTTTWSSSKIRNEIDSSGGGFEPKYSFAKAFRGLSSSYTEKINTLTDFPDVTIEAGKLYLVCFGIFNNGVEIVDSMNTNFKLEILTNGYEQRSIEVNQPTGRYQKIFGTSIQPFVLPINSGATNVGFKLYGNNNGEKSNIFNFVMKIYELGDLTN